MEISIVEFDVYKGSREEWDRFHKFRKQYHDDTRADDPFIENEEFEELIKAEMSNQDMKTTVFNVEHEKEIIALLLYFMYDESSASYKGNEKNLTIRFELDKKYRRKLIGSKVLEHISKFAHDNNKTNLITSTNEEDGKAFLKALDAKTSLVMRENRLYLKDVNWSMVSSWVAEAEKLNKGTKLLLVTEVPESNLENYVKTLNFAGNQAPKDDLSIGDVMITPESFSKQQIENKKAGLHSELAYTLEKDGTVSGLTELIRFGSGKSVIRQNMTAVLNEYRGRKLGKWLKASLLLHVKEKYPELRYIVTGNAESNAPMLSINTRLGFKAYSETIFFQISLENLNKYISSIKGKSNITIRN